MPALTFGTKYANAIGDENMPLVDGLVKSEDALVNELVDPKATGFKKYMPAIIVVAVVAGFIYWRFKKGKK